MLGMGLLRKRALLTVHAPGGSAEWRPVCCLAWVSERAGTLCHHQAPQERHRSIETTSLDRSVQAARSPVSQDVASRLLGTNLLSPLPASPKFICQLSACACSCAREEQRLVQGMLVTSRALMRQDERER